VARHVAHPRWPSPHRAARAVPELGAAGGPLVQSWAIGNFQILVDEFRRYANGSAHFLNKGSVFAGDDALDVPAAAFIQHNQSPQEFPRRLWVLQRDLLSVSFYYISSSMSKKRIQKPFHIKTTIRDRGPLGLEIKGRVSDGGLCALARIPHSGFGRASRGATRGSLAQIWIGSLIGK